MELTEEMNLHVKIIEVFYKVDVMIKNLYSHKIS